ncbi:hypothetical protein BGX24_008470 [Mortierella sp. AD032]|nr:hypothetical protein BGX24_008470 [Mortierella sp. AD032]
MLAVDYSLDGQKIASSYSRTAIRIRNEHDGELQQTLEHDDFVSCFAFSSCGQWMTVGCGPSVWLWRSVPNGTGSAQEWAPKAVILGSSSNVKCVAWRPSSLEFVTVSEDGSFRLWKLQLQNESDELSARMEWGVGPAVFTALDAVVGDAVGLGNINRQLLVGARCHNWVSILGC